MTGVQSTRSPLVQELIDEAPMTGRRWAVIGLCFIIALLDGFDTQSIAFIGPSIAEEFGMAATDMTWVITASTIGMALGAMTLGSAGDRIGRKNAIIISMILFGVFSIIASFAVSPTMIIALRFLIGLGMGGATPSLLALTAEYSPSDRRGTFLTLVLLGLPGGALIGGLVAAAWLPVVGWRGIFLIGGLLPLALLVVVFTLLPESPSFLAAHPDPAKQARARTVLARVTGRQVGEEVTLRVETKVAQRGSVRSLFAPQYRLVTTAIWTVYLFNWIAWFLLLQWMPTALTSLGLEKSTAALGTVTVNGAFILFAIPLSLLLHRVNVRTLLLAMFGFGIALALGLGLAGTNWAIVFVLLALAGFGVGGQQLVLNYLISNAYPTQLRATATGWSIGIGRTGSIVGSALGGWLLATFGVSGYFMMLAVPLVIAALATLLVRTHTVSAADALAYVRPSHDGD